MLTETLLVLTIILVTAWAFFTKPAGLPPGKWGLPLIGHIPRDGKYIDEQLKDMQKQFGDIYLWKFGTQVQVFVHDYGICKQMFGNAEFVNRPYLPSMTDDSGEILGIVMTNGAPWHTNRRFTLRQLRDLGMGKASLITAMHEQVPVVLEALERDAGKEVEITSALNTAIINIIWKMVADKQFGSEDPRHKDLQQLMTLINDSFDSATIADMFSWLQYFIPKSVFRRWFKLDVGKAAEEKFFKYFDELIEEHQMNLNPDDPKDLIDAYLIEMKNKTQENGTWSVADLRYLIFDMFSAGSDTTTYTMKWLVLHMAAFPDVQRKLQQEIDKVLQKDVLPTLEDRQSMPYTEAVVNEVLRKSSLTNIGVAHSAVKDTTLSGYRIPKDTLVTSASMAIHHDERYWEEPHRFLPERWLSPEGKFVMKKEGFLPFGTGKRACIGESLARTEIFIFTASIFQKFNVSAPNGLQVDLLPRHDVMFFHEVRKQGVVFTLRAS
ncbi:cytochrome P450 2L1-like isoform X1 [Macrobrachium nipponense]|uniref:cytochrome P450 2L1-like isoform X1 n=1 Tax=Macrobrachium nipponense TaxID=159736 RepID=UPI0030C8B1B6